MIKTRVKVFFTIHRFIDASLTGLVTHTSYTIPGKKPTFSTIYMSICIHFIRVANKHRPKIYIIR